MASSTPYLVLLLCLASLLQQASLIAANPPHHPPPDDSRARFANWMTKYSKSYPSHEEEEKRFGIFKDNSNQIGAFRAQTSTTVVVGGFGPQTITTVRVGMNRFGDLQADEFAQQFTGFNSTGFSPAEPLIHPNHTWKPCCVDWRSSGAVTGVKFQGTCCKSTYLTPAPSCSIIVVAEWIMNMFV
ncbi:hypothetical protein ACQ4PT_051835 [Festuca glaucescens]